MNAWNSKLMLQGLTMLIVFSGSSIGWADSALPPPESPQCREGVEGTWYFAGPFPTSNFVGSRLLIKGGKIWWSYKNQSSILSLVNTKDTRQLYRLDPPLWDFWGDEAYKPYNHFLFQNPLGDFGLWLDKKEIWPCSVTVSFCINLYRAEAGLENNIDQMIMGTDECIHGNFVPYSLSRE